VAPVNADRQLDFRGDHEWVQALLPARALHKRLPQLWTPASTLSGHRCCPSLQAALPRSQDRGVIAALTWAKI
jgi:hypothetical protein